MFELLGTDFSEFHFLRPAALLGLIPALLIVAFAEWKKRSAGNWENIINPQLLPFLMQGDSPKKQRGIYWALIAWIIACISLAGPAWQQLPQPVHKKDAALILIMDLSPSMLAEDIKPSRLARARYKLIDILKARGEGYSALVVYGGEAYSLSPLTEDSNTIISLVPTLEPSLLPVYGSNTEEAVETALELAINGGYQQGDLLLITDGVASQAFAMVQSMVKQAGKFRLSILGVGTVEGAPIPSGSGGFVKGNNGAILIPKLSPASLKMLAQNSGGIYRTLSADDSDISALLDSTEELFPDATKQLERDFDLWDDQGFWLILLLLPIILVSFRKGNIAVILLLPMIYSDPAAAFEWRDLWQTADQQATKAMQEGDVETAQGLFKDPQWRGTAAYKAGDYQTAIDEFVQFDSADGHYNRGNGLAKTGDLDGAIEAYDQALIRQPEMEDAIANRALIEQLKKQQQEQQQNKDSGQDQQDQQNQDQQNQDQRQQQQSDSQSQQQQSDSEQEPEPSQEQQDGEKSEQQDAKDQNAQDQDAKQQKAQAKSEQEGSEQEGSEQEGFEQDQQQVGEPELTEEQKQAQQELQQWLRRVPDDPGGLLREKFRYQSRQRALQQRRPSPPNEQQQERW
jgi:Ca-activated chloride channel family protein